MRQLRIIYLKIDFIFYIEFNSRVKMSSYQQTRNQKRNLKQKMLFSAMANDISNNDFDTYYQKCQAQKNLRLQSQESVVEDSDTNSSGYSSASSSPTPSTYGDENDGVGDEDREMNSYQDYMSQEGEMKYDYYYEEHARVNSINFGCSNSNSYSRFKNSYERETFTDEEIDRAFYEAEKWADF